MLIVDDDIRNIFALTSVLEGHDMVIVSAETGRDAIEVLQNEPDIDIVLMDIMMPEMDGMDTMRAIRKMPQFKDAADHRRDRQGHEGRSREVHRGRGVGLPLQAGRHRANAGGAARLAASLSVKLTSSVPAEDMGVTKTNRQSGAYARWLRFPAWSARHEARMTSDEETVNILVVDDLPEKLLALRGDPRASSGENVVRARSGREALRQLLEQDFAVILLDVNMPGMDGFETAALHPPAQNSGAHADHLHHRLRRRDARRAGLLARRRRLHPLARRSRRPAHQGRRLRRSVPHDRAGQAAGRGARGPGPRTGGAGGGRGSDAAFTRSWPKRARHSRNSLDFDGDRARPSCGLWFPPWPTSRALPSSASNGRPAQQSWPGSASAGAVVRSLLLESWQPDGDQLGVAIGRVLSTGRVETLNEPEVSFPPEAPESAPGPVLRVASVFPLLARPHSRSDQSRPNRFGRPFTPNELSLAEDLAGRAAIALDNARLFFEVQEADRQKNEFLAMLAHELRNPLAPIRNAVQLLQAESALPRQQQWAKEVIGRQVQQMVRMVDDLLDVSRITRGKINLRTETIDVATVVANAVETSRPLIEARRHELTVSVPPQPIRARGDPARLAQVIANLLNNAAKYTEEGGRIALLLEREGTDVVVRIRDTGVGVPPDMLARFSSLSPRWSERSTAPRADSASA